MRNSTLLLSAFTICLTLTGCGNSNNPVSVEETNKLCGTILDTGLTKQCSISNRDNAINIVIGTNDEAARSLCVDIAGKMQPLTADLPGQWKLQVFSPYRNDKPLAYCVLSHSVAPKPE